MAAVIPIRSYQGIYMYVTTNYEPRTTRMPLLDLISHLAVEEARLRGTRFIAPCVARGGVRTRVAGIVYSLRAVPVRYEGWGVFTAMSPTVARLDEEADPAAIDSYLSLFRRFHLRLAFRLDGRSWLAYPANESDMRQRIGRAAPVTIHLVDGADAFEPIVARWDGAAWWYEDIDRAADPVIADELRSRLDAGADPASVRIKGLTPEARAAYSLAWSRNRVAIEAARIRSDEGRLRAALERGGGELHRLDDRDDYWIVEWSTSDGARHSSAVTTRDLTVISAGICLSGRDREFDLQSLVGVVEERPGWMRREF
jgi:hypothetical protein